MRTTVTLFLVLLCGDVIAQEISPERRAAMLPWVAHDREVAMNDKALCSGDLALTQQKLAEALKQIEELKKPKPLADPAQ